MFQSFFCTCELRQGYLAPLHFFTEKAQRILSLQTKDINWEADVWYLDRFQFDKTRYDPTRPVRSISFLDIADRKNWEYLKIYIVSAWCDGNLCPKYLGADIYYKSLSAFS